MVKCWYLLGNGDGNKLEKPRELNQTAADSNDIHKISWGSLSKLRIMYWNLEVENYRKFNTFSLIKHRQNLDREYKISLNFAEYDFAEHMHATDEARFILDGEIYYDIYDKQQRIIRMHLLAGDFIIIPKYCLHRTILPENIKSVTFLQMTQTANEEEKLHIDDEQTLDKQIKTYFMADIQKDPQQFLSLMMQSSQERNLVAQNVSAASVNGTGFVMGGRAKALASYPHLREFNGMLFVSGTSSRRANNTHIGATEIKREDGEIQWDLNIVKQTRAVLENIKIILGTVGAGLQHLLAITVFLVDFKDYKGMNQVYNEYFDGDTGPTRTTVAVARLPHPNLLIEIQCTAAKPCLKL